MQQFAPNRMLHHVVSFISCICARAAAAVQKKTFTSSGSKLLSHTYKHRFASRRPQQGRTAMLYPTFIPCRLCYSEPEPEPLCCAPGTVRSISVCGGGRPPTSSRCRPAPLTKFVRARSAQRVNDCKENIVGGAGSIPAARNLCTNTGKSRPGHHGSPSMPVVPSYKQGRLVVRHRVLFLCNSSSLFF